MGAFTCSSIDGAARVCLAWVMPLEYSDGRHDEHLHAPVLRGAQHILRHLCAYLHFTFLEFRTEVERPPHRVDEVFCVLVQSGGSVYLPQIRVYLTRHPSHRSSCSSKRSKQTNQTTRAALCYVKTGRENTTRPCALARHQVISGQGRSPSARPGSHHAGPPHSHAAIAPCPRPQSRHRDHPPAAAARGRVLQGRVPRRRVQSRVQMKKAHCTQPRRAAELSLRATRQRAEQ